MPEEMGSSDPPGALHVAWTSAEIRMALVVALALALVSASLVFQTHPARAYDCSSHCYGMNSWLGTTAGAVTDISVVPLQCPKASCWSVNTGETAFITNEAWLTDRATGGNWWVEAGYHTYAQASGVTVDYFWADMRPLFYYALHDLGPVPQGDFGRTAEFVISSVGGCSPYTVGIASPNYYMYGQQSTDNAMTPNDIDIGQELSGYGGPSAPRAYFTGSQWEDYNGNFNYQTLDGSLYYNNPPYVGWSSGHKPSQSTTGGQLWTNCC